MSVLLFRILCFAAVPLGVYVLVRAIRFSKSSFYGELLLELPFARQQATFTVTEAGVYAIWQKGEMFKRTPVDKFKPVIYYVPTNYQVALYPSLMRASMNDGAMGRMELSTFSAEPGPYRLELQDGSSIGGLEKAVASLFSKPPDTSRYAVQVRRSQPFYYKILMVPLFLAAGWLMIGGLIGSLLADQIAPTLFK